MWKSIVKALAVVAVAFGAGTAAAQEAWPSRPIRIVVPFPAGGQLDVVVRLVADRLSPLLGQPIVVENKLGADGSIAAEFVARAPADGYTWLATSVPFATSIALHPKSLRYDPVKDFQPIASLGTSSFVLVVPTDVPAKTVPEFVAWAKPQAGKLSYGGTSVGSVTHLSTEMFLKATGLSMEMIPYAGIPPALTDLVTGRTLFMSLGLVAAQPQIKAGKLRPLAVASLTRSPLLPDVPTMTEAGVPGFEAVGLAGILAPAGTPPAIVERLSREIAAILRTPEVKSQLESMGLEVVASTPADFAAYIEADSKKWGKIIKDAGIKVE